MVLQKQKMSERGFVLVAILVMMMLLAVTAVTLNRRAGLQSRMASNQIDNIQRSVGQVAVLEKTIWDLTKDPMWRTTSNGEDFPYNGYNYNRKVQTIREPHVYTDITFANGASYDTITTSSGDFVKDGFLQGEQILIVSYSVPANSGTYTILNVTSNPSTIAVESGALTPGGIGDASATIHHQYSSIIKLSFQTNEYETPTVFNFFYNLKDFFYVTKPDQVFIDNFNNIYIADDGSHSVYRIDGITQVMTRIAGNGTSGYSGDGGPATEAQLNAPFGVWVDATGVIYIADRDNHRIRKVDLAGNISTFAGTVTGGYNGDNIEATSAKLYLPRGVYGDNTGNVYIADSANHIIRKVDSAGIITTIAGQPGQAGFPGLFEYVGLVEAISAKLNNPRSLFVTSDGTIYFADTYNCLIRKFKEGQNIFTVAGTWDWGENCGFSGDDGSPFWAKLNHPQGIYVDENSGYIYIADTDNNRIRRFTEGGTIETVAGTGTGYYSGDEGPATSAEIHRPRGVFTKTSGEIIISDSMNSCLREVDIANIITTITGNGDPGFNQPSNIAIYNGNIYIADKDNHQIRKLEASGKVTTIAGTGVDGYDNGDGSATSAQLNAPEGVALDERGNVYIADTQNHCIRKVDTEGVISTVAGQCGDVADSSPGTGEDAITEAEMSGPKGIAVENIGSSSNVIIYIADSGNHCIRKVTQNGRFYTFAGIAETSGYTGDNGPATSATLNDPHGVFKADSGNIYIADTDNNCIRKVSTNGNISTVAGDSDGTACDRLTNPGCGDGGAATSATLTSPYSVFVDTAGNLFIADQGNQVIRVVSADSNNIFTLAGTGSGGYNGDDQPAVETQLNSPAAVVMSETRGGQKIYISDTANNRIRYLTWKLAKTVY